ncbi:transport and Golgi organization 2 homolog [Physella acuta]|uniref:transport and Golgi organization 2 homolog n=1 Tax=Physella acuta TaxID=109671 RepID=UPI0027DE5212|nr:transport and Golgi organization 2 homolog [Physella acuta]
MCILFFYLSEICSIDGYKLVLVNNRDETWDRPTKATSFWDHDSSCISGLDQMSGRSGGTWLGMSREGKIGVLLNILGQQDHTKEGRGFLVTNFISGKHDIHDYAQEILEQKNKYNGFNLILFDMGKQEDYLPVKPVYVSNASNYFSCVNMRTLPSNTSFAVSNSPLEYPFQKVMHGRERFGRIISQFPTVNMKGHLIQELFTLMSDQSSLLPDPVLEKAAVVAGLPPHRVSHQSAINVYSPDDRYGTTITTIILVDSQGTVDFIEHTLNPANQGGNNISEVHEIFSLSQIG